MNNFSRMTFYELKKVKLILVYDYGTGIGWPRHRDIREFGCSFFQTGKTQGIFYKYDFTQGL